MGDLDDRFQEVDRLALPVGWNDVVERSPSSRPLPPLPSPGWRRPATIALALMLPAALGLSMWLALRSGDRPDPPAVPSPPVVDPTPTGMESSPTAVDPSAAPVEAPPTLEPPFVADVWRGVDVGSTELPAPPEVRSGAATAWTGRYLFVWGGYVYTGFSDEPLEKTGFVFDALDRSWTDMAPSPLAARLSPAAAWTGSEFLVWGGWRKGPPFYGDGAAYDPRTGTWRVLPPAPIEARVPLPVWTGEELIVWGTGARPESGSPQRDGAAYDPGTDSWRLIAEGPIELTDATAVWTGEEMIVFGAALHGGNFPETETAIGAAYDPETDSWRRIPESDLSPQASTAAWNGRELIAWDSLNQSAAYDPVSDSWRKLPRVPLDDCACSPVSVSVEGYVVGDYGGLLTLYDPDQDRWANITKPPLAGWVVKPVAAGEVVIVLAQAQDGDERRAFAYRPA
jgi:hypothetical protein